MSRYLCSEQISKQWYQHIFCLDHLQLFYCHNVRRNMKIVLFFHSVWKFYGVHRLIWKTSISDYISMHLKTAFLSELCFKSPKAHIHFTCLIQLLLCICPSLLAGWVDRNREGRIIRGYSRKTEVSREIRCRITTNSLWHVRVGRESELRKRMLTLASTHIFTGYLNLSRSHFL
jgi:hypothetical protein